MSTIILRRTVPHSAAFIAFCKERDRFTVLNTADGGVLVLSWLDGEWRFLVSTGEETIMIGMHDES